MRWNCCYLKACVIVFVFYAAHDILNKICIEIVSIVYSIKVKFCIKLFASRVKNPYLFFSFFLEFFLQFPDPTFLPTFLHNELHFVTTIFNRISWLSIGSKLGKWQWICGYVRGMNLKETFHLDIHVHSIKPEKLKICENR